MSRGPGRIERAIRALFDAHPDEAYTIISKQQMAAMPPPVGGHAAGRWSSRRGADLREPLSANTSTCFSRTRLPDGAVTRRI
jgi:hypothetical protein